MENFIFCAVKCYNNCDPENTQEPVSKAIAKHRNHFSKNTEISLVLSISKSRLSKHY